MTNNPPRIISDIWDKPATIEVNHFQHKSLSNFSYNTAVGCGHGCRFCYVPETSVNKFKAILSPLGVADPDADWGRYVFPRKWDEKRFVASLRHAENMPVEKLPADGHRAVMFCTTTDPYQVINHPDAKTARKLTDAHRHLVRRALELIRDHSTLRVRILTRGLLARVDFDMMKTLGHRLLFGMSLPTLDDRLARLYEIHAPAPSRRLETLQAAKAAGLHVYVAVAPTLQQLAREGSLGWAGDALAFLYPNGTKYRRWPHKDLLWEGTTSLWRGNLLPSATDVYLTEGETDAIALIDSRIEETQGTLVVAAPSATTFKEEWAEQFKGKTVTLCFDNDKAGENAVQTVAFLLKPYAKDVRMRCKQSPSC